MTERFPTGIFGLDQLVDGGLRENTALVVVGSSGTGKSTFAMQFLMRGIEEGEQGLYITLEEPPEQIIREGEIMGFPMKRHHDKELFFIHLKGQNFKKMVDDQLPQLVKARADFDIRTRVVVDPMTPLIWASPDKLEQRELVSKLFETVKKLGAVLATVEEHAQPGVTVGEDVLLPLYLADGAVHLEYYPIGGAFNRTLKVLKMRGTHHGEGVYPYMFIRGVGIVVRASSAEMVVEEGKSYDEVFDEALKTAEFIKAPEHVVQKITAMKDHWDYDYSPEEALQIIFDTYGLQ